MANKKVMEKAIAQKSRWWWLNNMVERGLVTKEKAIKLKRNIASGAVVFNPIVGLVSKIELDNLIENKILIKRENDWAIPAEEIIKNGKKILIISKKYSEWENRRKALASATHYNKEAMDSLIEQEEIKEEVDKLFPGSKVVD